MSHRKHRDSWEWSELVWPNALSPERVRDALEHLASSTALGPIVLETRAAKTGLRWLVAAQPHRIEAVAHALTTYLDATVLAPIRIRDSAEHAGEIRVIGVGLSLDSSRITAAVRGLYGALSRLRTEEAVDDPAHDGKATQPARAAQRVLARVASSTRRTSAPSISGNRST